MEVHELVKAPEMRLCVRPMEGNPDMIDYAASCSIYDVRKGSLFTEPTHSQESVPWLALVSPAIYHPTSEHDWIRLPFVSGSNPLSVMPLPIRYSMKEKLTELIRNNTMEPKGTILNSRDVERIQQRYIHCLTNIGLSCSHVLLRFLSYGIYPLDASSVNIQHLSLTKINPEAFHGWNEQLLYIFSRDNPLEFLSTFSGIRQ